MGLPLSTTVALGQSPVPDSARTATATPQTLFKLGVSPPKAWGSYWGFKAPLYVGVERAVGKHFSATLDSDVLVGFSRGGRLAGLTPSVGVRYYYNQARRQRLGKATTRLGGTYVQLQYTSNFTRMYSPLTYDGPAQFQHEPSAELLWGWQRQLGRYGFVDAGAGLQMRQQPWYQGYSTPSYRWQPSILLRVRAGFAF
ncbi:hypothetical protein D3Y59_14540 [Hymenobacter oligotrophus]|uniref:DUF3575 domain-containing protein n=1 Tax=Hymenobacter oligotrophus TaxID=2319843 RepID=A0A3B7RBU0_9BACT|nr:hypothetical protein D3Y59_14540 [Hymenobacter oligotrophus]